MAIGHVRYFTSGGVDSWEAAQPHISAIDEVLIALAHNGTLVNTNYLKAKVIDYGVHLRAGTDSESSSEDHWRGNQNHEFSSCGYSYGHENHQGRLRYAAGKP